MEFLRMKEVCERVGFCRSTLYKLMSENKFPQPIKIGDRAIAWTDDTITEWMQQRIDQSTNPTQEYA